MIKIPKSIDELKQMVADTHVNEIFDKVKSTFTTDNAPLNTENVKGDYQQILLRLKTSINDQSLGLNDLQAYIASLHQEIADLRHQLTLAQQTQKTSSSDLPLESESAVSEAEKSNVSEKE